MVEDANSTMPNKTDRFITSLPDRQHSPAGRSPFKDDRTLNARLGQLSERDVPKPVDAIRTELIYHDHDDRLVRRDHMTNLPDTNHAARESLPSLDQLHRLGFQVVTRPTTRISEGLEIARLRLGPCVSGKLQVVPDEGLSPLGSVLLCGRRERRLHRNIGRGRTRRRRGRWRGRTRGRTSRRDTRRDRSGRSPRPTRTAHQQHHRKQRHTQERAATRPPTPGNRAGHAFLGNHRCPTPSLTTSTPSSVERSTDPATRDRTVHRCTAEHAERQAETAVAKWSGPS